MRRLLFGLLLVGCAVGAWLAWQAWHVYHDLSVAADQAAVVQTAVSAGDVEGSKTALAQMQQHLASAHDRTHGPAWSLATHLPVVGDDARGVRLVSEVMSDLTRDGVEPLAGKADEISQLVPHDGRIPWRRSPTCSRRSRRPGSPSTRPTTVSGPRTAPAIWAAGRSSTATWRPASLTPGGRWTVADKAVRLLPSMLGQDGVRRYLVVFQNNAEVRATGGLPGSVAVVEADDGQIKLKRIVTGASFGETAAPVLPLTPAEQALYGDQLGTWFLDANFTPDFPRAADLWRARYEQQNSPVDGVLSIDPVALSYLLEGSRPSRAAPTRSPPTTRSRRCSTPSTSRSRTRSQQDETFRAIAKAVFERVTAGGIPSDVLLRGLARSAREHRLYVHSFHHEEQQALEGTEVSGELSSGPATTPQVGVYLNDTTGAKMSYYLRTRVNVDGLQCRSGVQTLAGHGGAGLPGSGPRHVAGVGHRWWRSTASRAGSQLVTVRLYGPWAATSPTSSSTGARRRSPGRGAGRAAGSDGVRPAAGQEIGSCPGG